MTESTERKSPEEWEAQDHITSMKAILHSDTIATCPTPDAPRTLLRALIWMIRRMDIRDKAANGKHGKTHASFLGGLFVFDGFKASDVIKLGMIALALYALMQFGKAKDEVKTHLREEMKKELRAIALPRVAGLRGDNGPTAPNP